MRHADAVAKVAGEDEAFMALLDFAHGRYPWAAAGVVLGDGLRMTEASHSAHRLRRWSPPHVLSHSIS